MWCNTYLSEGLGDQFFGERIRRPGALLYKHSGNFYGRKGENEGEIQKASKKKGEGKEEREKGPIRPVLLPALLSLSSKTEKEAVQEKNVQGL